MYNLCIYLSFENLSLFSSLPFPRGLLVACRAVPNLWQWSDSFEWLVFFQLLMARLTVSFPACISWHTSLQHLFRIWSKHLQKTLDYRIASLLVLVLVWCVCPSTLELRETQRNWFTCSTLFRIQYASRGSWRSVMVFGNFWLPNTGDSFEGKTGRSLFKRLMSCGGLLPVQVFTPQIKRSWAGRNILLCLLMFLARAFCLWVRSIVRWTFE